MKPLFIAEAVTLAHVGRTVALAEGLRQRGLPVEVAVGGEAGNWPTAACQHPLPGIGAKRFAAALRHGTPVLDFATLMQMIEADRALLTKVRPDIVIGDFRLSLSISARLEGIRYASITNAYWCLGFGAHLPMPVLPMTRFMPLPLAEAMFRVALPVALGRHCAPMNRARVHHGLAGFGNDLRRVYTDADDILLLDLPDLFPGVVRDHRTRFIGPVLWAPDVKLPGWWDEVKEHRPLIYVSLGSSGDGAVLSDVVHAVAELPVNVVVASAGQRLREEPAWDRRVYVAPYLPGDIIARHADVVICNGGSMGCLQALAVGKPVIGVAMNMDQFLNMNALVQAGLATLIRADRVSKRSVRLAVDAALGNSGFASEVGIWTRRINTADPVCELQDYLLGLVDRRAQDSTPI